MEKIEIRYASVSGNTDSFISELKQLSDNPINAIKIDEGSQLFHETSPYIAIVPTYLSGGTGTGDDVLEEFTWPLHDHIEYSNNSQMLAGVIGSGNLNFNDQFALTAKRYAKEFDKPLLYTYELRGTSTDVSKVLEIIATL